MKLKGLNYELDWVKIFFSFGCYNDTAFVDSCLHVCLFDPAFQASSISKTHF